MPAARLKTPVLASMPPPKITFPKSYPLFNSECQIVRRAKQVEMIRHQQIITDEPGGRGLPCLMQMFVGIFVSHPRRPVFCCHCEQDDVVPAKLNVNARRRVFPADFVCSVVALQFHAFLVRSRRSLAPPKLILRVTHFAMRPPDSFSPRARRGKPQTKFPSLPTHRAPPAPRVATSRRASPFATATSRAMR